MRPGHPDDVQREPLTRHGGSCGTFIGDVTSRLQPEGLWEKGNEDGVVEFQAEETACVMAVLRGRQAQSGLEQSWRESGRVGGQEGSQEHTQ